LFGNDGASIGPTVLISQALNRNKCPIPHLLGVNTGYPYLFLHIEWLYPIRDLHGMIMVKKALAVSWLVCCSTFSTQAVAASCDTGVLRKVEDIAIRDMGLVRATEALYRQCAIRIKISGDSALSHESCQKADGKSERAGNSIIEISQLLKDLECSDDQLPQSVVRYARLMISLKEQQDFIREMTE